MRGYGDTGWSCCWRLYLRCLRERDVGTLDVLPSGGPHRGALKKRARRSAVREIASGLREIDDDLDDEWAEEMWRRYGDGYTEAEFDWIAIGEDPARWLASDDSDT